MYTDYTKLWKLLLEKQLTKTDLCRATGISTRTLAKLVANRSVTTDTLLTICETLDCDISDIMEFTREEPERSLFSIYREHAKKATDEGRFASPNLSTSAHGSKSESRHKPPIGTQSFIAAQRVSNGNSSIPSASLPSPRAPYVPPPFFEEGKVCIALIDGAPGNITGLDEGFYLSAKREYGEGKLYVMSATAFKLFRTADKA